MKLRSIGLLAALVGALGSFGALALSPNQYDAHTRLVLDDGAGNGVFAPRPTYRYSGLAFSPVATPTDIIQIQGSATKTLRVTRIAIGGVATAQGNMPVQIIRRSTAGTAGSAVLTAVTAVKLDTSDAAASATVSTIGTANFTTLGTSSGVLAAGRLNMPAAGTGAATGPLVFTFAPTDTPLRLRGASDWIGVNLNGAAVPSGGVIDWEIEIEEDNS